MPSPPTKRIRLESSALTTSTATTAATPTLMASAPATTTPVAVLTDLHAARKASSLRVLDVWSQLADRYARPLSEDDVVDLGLRAIVKDRGVLARADRDYGIGCFADSPAQNEPKREQDAEQEEGRLSFTPDENYEDDDEIEILDIVPAMSTVQAVPPVCPMDPADAEDLRQFLEDEQNRRSLHGEEEEGDDDVDRDALLALVNAQEEEVEEEEDDSADERDLDALAASTSDGDALDDDESDDELGVWNHDEGSAVYQVASTGRPLDLEDDDPSHDELQPSSTLSETPDAQELPGDDNGYDYDDGYTYEAEEAEAQRELDRPSLAKQTIIQETSGSLSPSSSQLSLSLANSLPLPTPKSHRHFQGERRHTSPHKQQLQTPPRSSSFPDISLDNIGADGSGNSNSHVSTDLSRQAGSMRKQRVVPEVVISRRGRSGAKMISGRGLSPGGKRKATVQEAEVVDVMGVVTESESESEAESGRDSRAKDIQSSGKGRAKHGQSTNDTPALKLRSHSTVKSNTKSASLSQPKSKTKSNDSTASPKSTHKDGSSSRPIPAKHKIASKATSHKSSTSQFTPTVAGAPKLTRSIFAPLPTPESVGEGDADADAEAQARSWLDEPIAAGNVGVESMEPNHSDASKSKRRRKPKTRSSVQTDISTGSSLHLANALADVELSADPQSNTHSNAKSASASPLFDLSETGPSKGRKRKRIASGGEDVSIGLDKGQEREHEHEAGEAESSSMRGRTMPREISVSGLGSHEDNVDESERGRALYDGDPYHYPAPDRGSLRFPSRAPSMPVYPSSDFEHAYPYSRYPYYTPGSASTSGPSSTRGSASASGPRHARSDSPGSSSYSYPGIAYPAHPPIHQHPSHPPHPYEYSHSHLPPQVPPINAPQMQYFFAQFMQGLSHFMTAGAGAGPGPGASDEHLSYPPLPQGPYAPYPRANSHLPPHLLPHLQVHGHAHAYPSPSSSVSSAPWGPPMPFTPPSTYPTHGAYRAPAPPSVLSSSSWGTLPPSSPPVSSPLQGSGSGSGPLVLELDGNGENLEEPIVPERERAKSKSHGQSTRGASKGRRVKFSLDELSEPIYGGRLSDDGANDDGGRGGSVDGDVGAEHRHAHGHERAKSAKPLRSSSSKSARRHSLAPSRPAADPSPAATRVKRKAPERSQSRSRTANDCIASPAQDQPDKRYERGRTPGPPSHAPLPRASVGLEKNYDGGAASTHVRSASGEKAGTTARVNAARRGAGVVSTSMKQK